MYTLPEELKMSTLLEELNAAFDLLRQLAPSSGEPDPDVYMRTREFLRSVALPNGVEVYKDGTTNAFWVCNCPDTGETHFHNAYEPVCPVCGAKRETSSHAHVREVLAWECRWQLDRALVKEMEARRTRKTAYVATVELLLDVDDEGTAADAVSAILSNQVQGWAAGPSCLLDWGYVKNEDDKFTYPEQIEIALPYEEGDFINPL